jgi:hypothetical protein
VDNCFDFIHVDCKNREKEPGDKEANLGFNLGDELFYKAEKKEIEPLRLESCCTHSFMLLPLVKGNGTLYNILSQTPLKDALWVL